MHRLVPVALALMLLPGCTGPGSTIPPKSATILSTTGREPPETVPQAVDPERLAVGRELPEVDESIDAARPSGNLTKRQARNARKQVGVIARQADILSADGLTSMEANSLEISARGVESLVNAPAPPPGSGIPD